MALSRSFSASPGRTVIASILVIITLGTLLLALPAARTVPMSFVDLLFTATSATCVTGLQTIPIQKFTFFGQAIILFLIQIGGIGLITMTIFLISLFMTTGMKTTMLAGELLELSSGQNVHKFIKFIIGLTVSVELLGALIIYATLPVGLLDYPFFTALFHAISSFCSAGFSVMPNIQGVLADNLFFLGITSILIIVGEMGFITWHELSRAVKARWHDEPFHMSLHSRIVVALSILFLFISCCLIGFVEYANFFENSWLQGITTTFFNALSWRSSGFSTIDYTLLHGATYFLIMIISFVGTAPGSTGSGIKLTSVALIIATIRSIIKGRTSVEIKGRTIPNDQVYKAFIILALAFIWLAITIFALLVTEVQAGHSPFALIFEAFSAFTNLGITLGVTHTLTLVGKIIIMISMVVGRIGAFTLILAIKKYKDTADFHYPEERIMLS